MKKRIIPIVVLLVAVISVIVYSVLSGDNGDEELYNGILEARQIDVRAEVTGKVLSAPAREGDLLEEGEVICELDQSKLKLQLQGGESELQAQEARLEAMEKGAREQELEQLRLLLDQARTQSRKTEKDYGRIERLYHQGAISEYERDGARTARDLARDQEGRALQNYNLALEGVRDEELKAQVAIVDGVRAKVDYYRLQLEDAVIKSPVKGRLVERYVEPGELVMAGGLVASVADYRELELKVYVPEDRVGSIEPGRKAAVMIDSFPGRPLAGRVSRKSGEAEFTPKNVQTREERTTLVYEVTLKVENPEEWAVAGLPADVRFEVDSK